MERAASQRPVAELVPGGRGGRGEVTPKIEKPFQEVFERTRNGNRSSDGSRLGGRIRSLTGEKSKEGGLEAEGSVEVAVALKKKTREGYPTTGGERDTFA